MANAKEGPRFEGVIDESRVPGDILYEHPADRVVAPHQRILEVLHVVLPDGDFGRVVVKGPWGRSYDPQAFSEWERDVLNEAAEAFADRQGPRELAVIEREFRIESREDAP